MFTFYRALHSLCPPTEWIQTARRSRVTKTSPFLSALLRQEGASHKLTKAKVASSFISDSLVHSNALWFTCSSHLASSRLA